MPPAALVRLDQDLLEATDELVVRERIGRSLGLNFGTQFKAPGYTTWLIDDPIPPQLRRVTAEIITFDVLIDNADRRRDKPNILYKEDEILLIDHETAFAFTRLVGPAPVGWNVERINFLYNHPFYSGLRGQSLDLERFATAMARLTDEEIHSILAAVPADFGDEHLETIGLHLASARNGVQQMIETIRRIMQ